MNINYANFAKRDEATIQLIESRVEEIILGFCEELKDKYRNGRIDFTGSDSVLGFESKFDQSVFLSKLHSLGYAVEISELITELSGRFDARWAALFESLLAANVEPTIPSLEDFHSTASMRLFKD